MAAPATDLNARIEATAPESKARLAELFRSGRFILGEQVDAFEREFAAALGARFAVGVGSGTAAIELCLRGAGLVGPKQEVLTSALTSPFTALAILAAGATPRFADVDPETLLLDPGDAAARLTRRSAAIMPVHLYGQLCALDRLVALAKTRRLVLIQDACQAHGARYAGRALSAFSSYVAYSFYPTKNLGCLGDGGAVVTNTHTVARRMSLLRDGGRRGGQVSFVRGINSRLDEMQACYLRAFLPHLDQWNARRARIAALYDEALAGCGGVRPVRRESVSVNHLYVVRARRRPQLRDYLAKRGIVTAVHYPVPLHLHPAFQDCGLRRGDLPCAERACREILSLPIGPYLSDAAVEEVAKAIRAFYA